MATAWKLKRFLPACQAARLLWVIAVNTICAAWCVFQAVLRLMFSGGGEDCAGIEFFEGTVTHVRCHEGSHAFTYHVRMALVDLDCPPHWWQSEAATCRLSACEAREAAGTTGRVLLLTTPSCAGYDQNPIQLYYCEDEDGGYSHAVCEVTNTPWNHRVHFLFELNGATLAKPLHVSPLMDLDQRWHLRATPPVADKLEVDVDVLADVDGGTPPPQGSCRTEKPLLCARLRLQRSIWTHARAEHAGSLRVLWMYGLQPHRTAVRIYTNAIRLLWKGVAFRPHPPPEYKHRVLERMRTLGGCSYATGTPWWIDNDTFPFGPSWSKKS